MMAHTLETAPTNSGLGDFFVKGVEVESFAVKCAADVIEEMERRKKGAFVEGVQLV